MDWFKPKPKPTEEEEAELSVLREKFRLPYFRKPIDNFRKPIDKIAYTEKLKNNPEYQKYLEMEKRFRGGKTRKRKKKRSSRIK